MQISIIKCFIGGAFILYSVGCTLYESSGHQAIEENKGNLVGSYFAMGASVKHDLYYMCQSTQVLPDFLKNALEVIESRHESNNISVLLDRQSSPTSIAVYHYDELQNEHLSCRVYFLASGPQKKSQILKAADLAVEKLKARLDHAQDAGPGNE